jgi:hypothetical protein
MKPCSSFSATQTPWPLAPTRAASLGAPHRTLARSAAASPACRRGRPHPRRTLQTPRRLHELLVRAAGPRGVIAAPATRLPAATAGGCSAAPTAVDTHRHRSGGQISCLPSNSRVCRFAEQAASSANGGCCLPSNRSAARGSRCLSASESESIDHHDHAPQNAQIRLCLPRALVHASHAGATRATDLFSGRGSGLDGSLTAGCRDGIIGRRGRA